VAAVSVCARLGLQPEVWESLVATALIPPTRLVSAAEAMELVIAPPSSIKPLPDSLPDVSQRTWTIGPSQPYALVIAEHRLLRDQVQVRRRKRRRAGPQSPHILHLLIALSPQPQPPPKALASWAQSPIQLNRPGAPVADSTAANTSNALRNL
jgi:hypothetical protein